MKQYLFSVWILSLLFLSGLASCVSSKKYKELEAQQQKEKIQTQGLENQVDLLEQDKERLLKEVRQLKKEKTEFQDQVQAQERYYDRELSQWEGKYNQLNRQYQSLLQNSALEANARQQLNNSPNNPLPVNGNNYSSNPVNYQSSNKPNNSANPNYANPAINTAALQGSQGSTPLQNKGYSNTPTVNSNLDQVNYYNQNDVNLLNNLLNQLKTQLASANPNELVMRVLNGQLYVALEDAMLYQDPQYNLSSRGQAMLQVISQVLKNQQNLDLSVISRADRSNENPFGYLKAKQVGTFLNQQGLAPKFHKKNFAPLAFDTSGTEVRNPYTTLVIGVK